MTVHAMRAIYLFEMARGGRTLMQSVIYAFAALGIMIPFRLLSFPDLTVEGSFPFGGCVAAASPPEISWIGARSMPNSSGVTS